MEKGFMEAAAAFWDKRADTLAPQSKAMDAELEKALNRLSDILTSEQMDTYMDAEDAMNRREATIKEFFYRVGFQDALRFLFTVLHCADETLPPKKTSQYV
jgi:hypothetical protein